MDPQGRGVAARMPFCPDRVTGCKRLQQVARSRFLDAYSKVGRFALGQMPPSKNQGAMRLPCMAKTNIFVIYVPGAHDLAVRPHKTSCHSILFASIFVICRIRSFPIAFGGPLEQKNGKSGVILCAYGHKNQLPGT